VGNVTVIGAQWGDEGKGKIVDWLASRADMVVRFQGGHNAGHTLVVGNQTYKLSLLPSGIVRGTPSVIGNGVVLDPWALKAEVERIREQGVEVTPNVLRIAETCPLILPIHRDLDGLREDASGVARSGRPGAASAPPMRIRSAAARSASATLLISASWDLYLTACARTTTRFAPASASRRSTASACCMICPKSPISSCHSPGPCGATSTRRGGAGDASCSRAHKGCCSTSTTAPIRSSPRPTP